MAESAELPLPFPETGVVDEDSLGEQTLALASDLPERPLVLGGCCCAHVGAVEGLAARHDRLGVVWLDAHGDLNTAESSPSGNAWGMPLRMLIDSGAVDATSVALVAARNLDPPEQEFIETTGIHTDAEAIERATAEADSVYVALDADAFDSEELCSFMPEPGGLSIVAGESMLRELAKRKTIVGAGVSGLRPDPRNVEPITRLVRALGL
jgi:arginase